MKFKIKIGQREFEIEILEEKEGTKIKVGNKEFVFKEKEKEKEFISPETSLSKEGKEKKEIEILAPIAGEISEVFAKEGQKVKKGQRIFLLSAMKMENEILAEKEGQIKKIFVKKGDKVKKDQVLAIFEIF